MTNVKYEDNTTNNNQSLENTPVPMDVDSSNVNKLDETKPGSASTANAGTSSSSKKKNKKKKKKN